MIDPPCGGPMRMIDSPCGGPMRMIHPPCGGPLRMIDPPCGGPIRMIDPPCGGLVLSPLQVCLVVREFLLLLSHLPLKYLQNIRRITTLGRLKKPAFVDRKNYSGSRPGSHIDGKTVRLLALLCVKGVKLVVQPYSATFLFIRPTF